jgi:hypothetical protein
MSDFELIISLIALWATGIIVGWFLPHREKPNVGKYTIKEIKEKK